MAEEKGTFVTTVAEVAPKDVQAADGWHKMDIRFLIPPEHQQPGCEVALFRAIFPPGAQHAVHRHAHAPEFFYVLAGRPVIGDRDGEREVGPGTMQLVPAGAVHWLRNPSPDTTVEVVGGYVGATSLETAGYERVE